ncbi:hypothetical protein BLNAU_23315 [Blattamonas nauphoetae]|uniref:Uncharacterized protein n=1 Tax=Blattamonas nauphoetae TaxID=2049346 RepID=A0ABQ9WQK6_9EUKA|nr:hypothetical protein BLNAU_23315 [Blattamonas nauphoetae]
MTVKETTNTAFSSRRKITRQSPRDKFICLVGIPPLELAPRQISTKQDAVVGIGSKCSHPQHPMCCCGELCTVVVGMHRYPVVVSCSLPPLNCRRMSGNQPFSDPHRHLDLFKHGCCPSIFGNISFAANHRARHRRHLIALRVIRDTLREFGTCMSSSNKHSTVDSVDINHLLLVPQHEFDVVFIPNSPRSMITTADGWKRCGTS